MPDEHIATVNSVAPGSASANGTPIHVTSVQGASVQTATVMEGGGGETIDYNDLISKPRINGVVLASDKTSNDLHIVSRGLTAQWEANPDYVPRNGEIVVYTDHRSVSNNGAVTYTPGIKVGDGSTHVGNLPFAEAIDSQLSTTSTNPVQNAVLTSVLSNIEAALYLIEQKLAVLYDNDKNGTGTWTEQASRGTTYAFNCYKRGKLGIMFIDFNKTATATGSGFVEIGQLPEGYYPSRQFYMQVPIQSQNASVTISIQTDGTLSLYGNHTTSGRIRCTMAYTLRQADY